MSAKTEADLSALLDTATDGFFHILQRYSSFDLSSHTLLGEQSRDEVRVLLKRALAVQRTLLESEAIAQANKNAERLAMKAQQARRRARRNV